MAAAHGTVVRGRAGALALVSLLGACGGGGSNPAAPTPTSTPTPPPATEQDPLRADAEASGRLVGAAIQSRYLAEPLYARTLARHFNYATAENEMKWDATERQPGVFTFAGDAIVAFAAANTACRSRDTRWSGTQLPDWVRALAARTCRRR